MQHRSEQHGHGASPSAKAPRRRVRVVRNAPDALRRVRKRKTFAGYALIFVLLFASLLLNLAGAQTLGNTLILAAVFWGLVWWRLSPKLYSRFVGDLGTCPDCGSDLELVDAWKCPACGSVSTKHILDPCEHCGLRGGKLGCPSCGRSISV